MVRLLIFFLSLSILSSCIQTGNFGTDIVANSLIRPSTDSAISGVLDALSGKHKNSKKIKKLLRNYFKESVGLIQTRNPIILFNKKKLKHLNYQWHQESQFYPEHNAGLHIWTPLFRDLKDKNDGGLQFAATGNETNFEYREIKKKDSYIQRVPTIDIKKNFETISVGANIGDAIIFENKSVHRSDINNSKTPRVATVFRYLSNVGINHIKFYSE